jgi:cell division protein ZapA
MNQEQALPVSVTVLDKEFRIACPPHERDALIRAARHLDAKMREIRHTGKVIGNDRVAVMAAINLAHELLQLRDNQAVAGFVQPGANTQAAIDASHIPAPTSVTEEAENLHQRIQATLKDCKAGETD